jgi:CHASE2 domain-containing sensor protein
MADPQGKKERSGSAFALAQLWDSRWFQAIVWAQAIWAAILLLWIYGGLQPPELLVYDMLRVAWAGNFSSDRVVLIGVTEADVERFDYWPLRDGDLATLLERIAKWKPRVIGVDIFQGHPVPPGTDRLAAVLAQHREIVWVFLPRDRYREVPPPEMLRGTGRAVLGNVFQDADKVVRRALLYEDDGAKKYRTMGMALALGYLAADDIRPGPGPDGRLRLGKALIPPLDTPWGPYAEFDSRGYQMPLDYWGGATPFALKSVGEVMHDDNAAAFVRGRAVIVGYASESIKDNYWTPFNSGFCDALPRVYAAFFVWFWCVVGALAGATLDTRLRVWGVVGAGLIPLGVIVYGSFGLGLWLPGLLAALGWAASAGMPASWEIEIVGRLRRQARELRRVRLLASGRHLMLLSLMEGAEGSDGMAGADYRSEVRRELIAALAAVDPDKTDWTDT